MSAPRSPAGGAEPADARPLVSILLIAYNQQRLVADAVRGALAQTWQPLEIIVSDDASTDGTYAAIEAAVRDYCGPHRVIARRNEHNEGISAHLSRLAGLARGELLFVAAGDDISAPERCARVVEYWLAHERRFDLIATDLVDIDDTGAAHERIAPDGLDAYRSFDDWAARRPHLIGAAHAWSRRLFERFGPMRAGAMAEDQIMTFRAIMSGGASSLREPLVRYRRGGLSRKRRYRSAAEFVAHKRRSNLFSLAEVHQLQHDADIAGVGEQMRATLAPKLAREQFVDRMFSAGSVGARIALAARGDVAMGLRLRTLLYTCCPALYAPLLWAKRTFGK